MEAKHDFWSVSGSFIYQRHVMNQEKYAPREDAFPVPLKYIDVVRHTQTNLDIPQEHAIDYYYNVDSERHYLDTVNDHYLDLGFDSHDLQFRRSQHPKDICGPDEDPNYVPFG